MIVYILHEIIIITLYKGSGHNAARLFEPHPMKTIQDRSSIQNIRKSFIACQRLLLSLARKICLVLASKNKSLELYMWCFAWKCQTRSKRRRMAAVLPVATGKPALCSNNLQLASKLVFIHEGGLTHSPDEQDSPVNGITVMIFWAREPCQKQHAIGCCNAAVIWHTNILTEHWLELQLGSIYMLVLNTPLTSHL